MTLGILPAGTLPSTLFFGKLCARIAYYGDALMAIRKPLALQHFERLAGKLIQVPKRELGTVLKDNGHRKRRKKRKR